MLSIQFHKNEREFHSYNFNRFIVRVGVEKIHIHNGMHEIDCTMQFSLLLVHILNS